jgi:hypothetical protein
MWLVLQCSFLLTWYRFLKHYSTCCLYLGTWKGLTLEFSDQEKTFLKFFFRSMKVWSILTVSRFLICILIVSPALPIYVVITETLMQSSEYPMLQRTAVHKSWKRTKELTPTLFHRIKYRSYQSRIWGSHSGGYEDFCLLCPLKVNRRFGGTCNLQLEDPIISQVDSACYLLHAGFLLSLSF